MDTETYEAARAVAFRYLGYQARSRAEIEKRLERDEFAPEIIAQVLTDFETNEYINDAKLAQDWVVDRADRKNYGKQRLVAELRRKGVEREAVTEAIESVSHESEVGRALSAARAKGFGDTLQSADRNTVQAEKKRLAGFLQRRGFGWPIITQVISQLMSNQDE